MFAIYRSLGYISWCQPQIKMAQADQLKVLDSSRVSPPPGSVPTTSLHLTFFDMPWFFSPYIQRLFFYEFPYPTLHFTQTILPLLKHTLSLTLQHFFPIAANIICPPPPGKPYIHYKDGDFATLEVVESTANFSHVTANYPRDVELLPPFAPKLPMVALAPEDGTTRVLPVVAFQITLFPNAGICIGANFCHVCGDGKTFMHFMRSWTTIYRAGGDLTCLEKSLSLWNKELMIEDPDGAMSFLLKMYWNCVSSYREDSGPAQSQVLAADKVRATFVLGRAHVDRLKHLVTSQCKKVADSEQLHVSTFVVTSALIWVSLIKTLSDDDDGDDDGDDNDKFYYFLFTFDCRNRLEFPIPETYFGNCIKPCIAEMKKSELIGENGFVLAAKAIGSKVKEMEKSGLKGVENWIPSVIERIKTGRVISVAGSPKLHVYDTNFGWGKPNKVELVHVETGEAISLAECRDERGGIEVGLALNKDQMDEFVAVFEQSLKLH